MAVLAGTPVSHCVGDAISVEPSAVVMDGWKFWKRLQEMLGWVLSEEKSPLPSQLFNVVGVQLDLRPN